MRFFVVEIQCTKLSKSFVIADKKISVLHEVDVIFRKNYSYGITGVSGSGKSTLLHLLCRLEKPSAGSIMLKDAPLRKNNFGLVFQQDFLIEELNCQENIALAEIANSGNAKIAQQKAWDLLCATQMQNFATTHPRVLSGGQRTRISLCRALACNPDFLLADEPTSSLDQETAKMVITTILQLQQQLGFGLIIASHDPMVFDQMQHVLHLHNGQLTIVK